MDMKKKYAELLCQHHILMEDWGYVLPKQAYKEARGDLPSNDAVQVILQECLPATHKGDHGFMWRGYFWSGELKSTTYMLNTLEDLGWP